MTPDQIARLVFLSLLGAVILFWMFRGSRQSLNRILQQVVVWALLFVGVVAGFGLWKDIERSGTFSQNVSSQTGEITSPRAPDGHYYLTLEVNGEPVRFVVDTGASDMVLTRQDAETAGIDIENAPFYRRAQTANGVVRVAPVTIETVAIGPFIDSNISASINDGEMETSLLGMTYLHRFQKIEISGGEMILTR